MTSNDTTREVNVALIGAGIMSVTTGTLLKELEPSLTGPPLVMERRDPSEPIAATRMITGADVDYGALTDLLVAQLQTQSGFLLHHRHEVIDLKRLDDGRWRIDAKYRPDGATVSTIARFVFIGAGGAALPPAQKSGIPEIHGYGGFPVSGIWMRCDAPAVAHRHHVKVYGKAAHGSLPMSVPHLDMRVPDSC